MESGYLGEEGRGWVRKRWDTVSLGFVTLQVSPRLSGDGLIQCFTRRLGKEHTY